MASLIMPTLGEPDTCNGPCEHTDCAHWRAVVGSPCAICGAPVEAGEAFYFVHNAQNPEQVEHATCYQDWLFENTPACPPA